MPTSVTLPPLGDSVTEATITRWLKKAGEPVTEEEPLLEVSTDKVDTEIPSPVTGVLQSILAVEDDTVAIGDELATIAHHAAGATTSEPEVNVDVRHDRATDADPSASEPRVPRTDVSTSPDAEEPAVEISNTEADEVPAPHLAPAPSPAPEPRNAPGAGRNRGRTVRLTRLRTVIASRMVESLQVSAQLTSVVEVDLTLLNIHRSRTKDEFLAREGVRLTLLPFVVSAAARALRTHPSLNASLDMERGEATYYDHEHVAIAVDSHRGLLTPVVRDAGDLSISGLARAIADVAGRARSNRLSPDELSGGTFTVTNTGSRGALFDTPIINQPQVAILGVGAVVKRPVVIDDPANGESIGVRHMAYLSLTYDHRLVDGADAARYLVAVKGILEQGPAVHD